MDSALIVLVITLFFIFVIVVLVPEALRLLAVRLAQQRREMEREIGGLGRELQEAANRLRPFRELSASVYQRQYGPAREQLQQAVSRYRRGVDGLKGLAPLSVPSEGLATPLFMREPQLYNRIIRNWRLQRRTAGELAAARAALTGAQQGMGQLGGVPGELQQRSHALVGERLQAVEKALAEEAAAGIENLADFAEQRQYLSHEADALAQLLQREARAPLSQLNALALALEKVESETEKLEKDMTGVRERRAALDARRREVSTARNRVGGAVGTEGADAIVAVLEEADAQMAEAERLRPRRAFDGAEAALSRALALVQLAGALNMSTAQVAALEAIADDVADPEQVLTLRGQLDVLLDEAEETVVGDDGELRPEVVARLRERAERLQATATDAVTRHRQLAAQLEAQADKVAARLATAWQALQTSVAPLPGELLAQRYTALQRQRRAAAGRPVLLERYAGDAAALAKEMEELTDYLRRSLKWVAEVRGELDELLNEAQGVAGDWRSLQPYLQTLREETAAIYQINPAAEGLAGAEKALGELQDRYERARDGYDTLVGERQRLYRQEERILMVQDAIRAREEELDEAEMARIFELAQNYYAEARGAKSVDEAAAALQEVNRVLRELAG
jgi:DNA repair exonuclease SbcCD ATPase subunit